VSDDSLVVYVMVAPEEVTFDEEIDEITGGVVSDAGMVDEQEAVVPPLEPVHCHR
jgi:hypothetical protein